MSLSLNEKHDSQWWDDFYSQTPEGAFGKTPSAFLENNVDALIKGNALDLAMGEGRNAIFLAKQGFDVQGVDFSQVAIDRAQAWASQESAFVACKKHNLEFFLLDVMSLDNIVVIDHRPPLTLMKNLVRALKPGGILLLEGHTQAQAQKEKGYPQFDECFETNEALNHTRDLELIFYQERMLPDGHHRVQLIGRKKKL
ncbi:MAG: methyltransferase domain-containing protein [Bdellovibrionota bacterium]